MDRVGNVLTGLAARGPLAKRLVEARAFAGWSEVVGDKLAERTRPLRVADGRLFVLAQGASLRQELTFHAGMILRKFNALTGTSTVREVVFVGADALAGRESGTETNRPARPAGQAVTPAPVEEQEGDEVREPEDGGAMHVMFDAAAHRRWLESLAHEGEETTTKRV